MKHLKLKYQPLFRIALLIFLFISLNLSNLYPQDPSPEKTKQFLTTTVASIKKNEQRIIETKKKLAELKKQEQDINEKKKKALETRSRDYYKLFNLAIDIGGLIRDAESLIRSLEINVMKDRRRLKKFISLTGKIGSSGVPALAHALQIKYPEFLRTEAIDKLESFRNLLKKKLGVLCTAGIGNFEELYKVAPKQIFKIEALKNAIKACEGIRETTGDGKFYTDANLFQLLPLLHSALGIEYYAKGDSNLQSITSFRVAISLDPDECTANLFRSHITNKSINNLSGITQVQRDSLKIGRVEMGMKRSWVEWMLGRPNRREADEKGETWEYLYFYKVKVLNPAYSVKGSDFKAIQYQHIGLEIKFVNGKVIELNESR